jgi:hypothetical protein
LEAVVGEVVEFRPYRKAGKGSRSIARLDKELALPLQIARFRNRPRGVLTADRWPLHASGKSETSLPLVGIAIVACAILAYTIVALHVVGQPHYSARANLLPPVWSDD